MRILTLILLIICSAFWATSTKAQFLEPVDISHQVFKTGEKTYDLVFTADIDPGWYMYSQDIEDDDGPLPTQFFFEESDIYRLNGETYECGNGKEAYDQFFEMNLLKYSDRAVFIQSVTSSDPSAVVKGYYEFMTCDDSQCLPPFPEDFEVHLSTALDAGEMGYERDLICEKEIDGMGAIQDEDTEVQQDITERDQIVVKGIDKEAMTSPQDEEGILEPVKWTGEVVEQGDGLFTFIFDAQIEEGWAIYSHELDRFDGPRETSVEFDEGDHFEIHTPLTESSSNLYTGFDQFFEMELTKLETDAHYEVTILAVDESEEISGFIEYMACDSTQCLPPIALDFSFNPLSGVLFFNEVDTEQTGDGIELAEGTTRGEGTPVYYEFDYENATADCLGSEPAEKDSSNYWWIFIAGFIGGMVALLTPCVFPMIPLTVSFFTKSSTSKAAGLKNAIIYGISIIVIYVLLGLLITGIFGADALNLLSTNAWFNIFFAVLFIVFAISFFGYFEITLPSSWVNRTDSAADQGGLIGIFFMAFTLSLVSFSCTGPIIGTLLVETATGGGTAILGRIPVGPLIGMFGFSLALALPFGLFAAFPGWLNSMPKSGGWMNNIKVSLGFVEIALALKFLSIADLTMGWKILPYELFLILWIACAVGLALYFLGVIRFPHDGPVKRINTSRWVLSTSMLALAVYFSLGFRVSDQSESFQTPNILSGLAPPAGHSYILPNTCPLNLNCHKDFQKGMEYAKAQNKPVLLDFTGHGCVNCRRMEDQVWKDEEIYNMINDDFVLISLYVDERKALEEPYTSAFSNREMRNVGNKWADFQAIHFNRNSQPYYVLVSPEGKILNQPVAYLPERDAYKEFLECGLQRFAEEKTEN